MNWYYEINGVSQGPQNEAGMSELVSSKVISEGTLVWNPQLESWAPAKELKPKWLVVAPPPAPVREPEVSPAEEATKTAKRTRAVASAAAPQPAPSRLAGAEVTQPAKKKEAEKTEKEPAKGKKGLFSRLFGG